MKLYYSDHYPIPLPPGHKFPAGKYRLLRELLSADDRLILEPAPLADSSSIELAHDPDYVRSFLDGSVDPGVLRRIGFPWSPELARRTLASVGGTLSATRAALQSDAGGNLAGGTHHAFPSSGAGFCVFNDIAISIRGLLQNNLAARAAVIDLDVHQGDGVAFIFASEPRVFTLSLHGASNFPFRKQRSTLDVEFADRTGDSEYLAALEQALPRVWDFAPEIVFYQAGVDALASDRLGCLALTPAGLRCRDEAVFAGAKSRGIPVVITLGGGYSEPISLTAAAHAATFRLAARILCN